MKKVFTVIFILLLSLTLTACGDFSFGYYDSNPPLYEDFKLPNSLIFDQYKKSLITFYEDVSEDDLDYALTANIKIENELYDTGGLRDMFLALTYTGSGVIFYETNEFYDALTNQHVIATEVGYPNQKITVIDYYNQTYDAAIYPGSVDEDLDIAVIVFEKHEDKLELGLLKLVDGNIPINTQVIAIGNPNGKRNVITNGYIDEYNYTLVEDNNGESQLS